MMARTDRLDSGSQLAPMPRELQVIWVVCSQKIVKDLKIFSAPPGPRSTA